MLDSWTSLMSVGWRSYRRRRSFHPVKVPWSAQRLRKEDAGVWCNVRGIHSHLSGYYSTSITSVHSCEVHIINKTWVLLSKVDVHKRWTANSVTVFTQRLNVGLSVYLWWFNKYFINASVGHTWKSQGIWRRTGEWPSCLRHLWLDDRKHVHSSM